MAKRTPRNATRRARKPDAPAVSFGGVAFPVPVSNPETRVDYLSNAGEDLWAVTTPIEGTAVISLGDLAVAKQVVLGDKGDMRAQLGEDLRRQLSTGAIPAREILEALNASEAILTDCFGPEAYVLAEFQANPESGERELVLETHYRLPPDELDESDLERHEMFMRRFIAEIPIEAREHLVLVSVASDGNTGE